VSIIALDAPPMYTSDTIIFCPGAVQEVTLGPSTVNPAFDYQYTFPDMSQSTTPRPTVSDTGTYTLVISLKDSNAYCAIGASEVYLRAPVGPFSTALVVSPEIGFCESDAPSEIGVTSPPSGYTYSWLPTTALDDPSSANPTFDPAEAALDAGIRTINYQFNAIRDEDGCVYSDAVQVTDTTLGIALIPDSTQFGDGDGCLGGVTELYTLNGYKGKEFQWKAVATTFPGGLATLEAHPDYGLGAKGAVTSNSPNTSFYYPPGDYTVHFQFAATFGEIGSSCTDLDTVRRTIACVAAPGVGGGDFCAEIDAEPRGTLGGVCSGPDMKLFAQDQEWVTSSWTITEIDGTPGSSPTPLRGLFVVTNGKKGVALTDGSDHPTTVIAHLEDAVSGMSGAASVTYKFTGTIFKDGTEEVCESSITVYSGVNRPQFTLTDQSLTICDVEAPGMFVSGGETLPYTVKMSDYVSQPVGSYLYQWQNSKADTMGVTNPTTLYPTFSEDFPWYQLRVYDEATGCSAYDTLEMDIVPMEIGLGDDLSGYCPGTTVQLGNDGPQSGFTYAWTPTTGLLAANLTDPGENEANPYLQFPNATGGITYTRTVTHTNSGCVASTDLELTSSTAGPPTPDAASTVITCPGLEAKIGPASYPLQGQQFVWTATAPASASWLSATNVLNPNVTLPDGFSGTATFTMTVLTTSGCGSNAVQTFDVEVPQHGITLTEEPTQVDCSNPVKLEPTNLTVPSGFEMEWIPSLGLFKDMNGTTPYGKGDDINVYVGKSSIDREFALKIKHTASGCISVLYQTALAPAGIELTIDNPELFYCTNGEPVSIDGSSSGGTITWEATGFDSDPFDTSPNDVDASKKSEIEAYLGSLTSSSTTFSQSTPAQGAYEFVVTVDNGGGCSLSEEVIIRAVNPGDDYVPASQLMCEEDPTQINLDSVPQGFELLWTVVSPSASFGTISNDVAAQPIVTPDVETVYELTYTEPNSGCANSEQLIMQVAPKLEFSLVSDSLSCVPLTGIDVAALVNASEYASVGSKKWYLNEVPGPVITEPTSEDLNQSATYILAAANEFGCPDTLSINMLIEDPAKPVVPASYFLPQGQATFDLATLTPQLQSVVGGTYTWHTSDAKDVSNLVTNLVVFPGKYYLFEESPGGCLSESSSVELIPAPPYISKTQAQNLCGQATLPIASTYNDPGGVFTYKWQKNTVAPDSASHWADIPSSDSLVLNPGILTDTTWFRMLISLDGSNFTQFPGSNPIMVGVTPAPIADAGLAQPSCRLDSVFLAETGGNGVSWNWKGPRGFTDTLQNPLVTNAFPGKYIVEVGVANCTATKSDTFTLTACDSTGAFIGLDFDGADDKVVLDSSTFFTGGSFTVEAWVLPRDFGNFATLLDCGNGPGNNNVVCGLSNGTSGQPYFTVFDGMGDSTKVTTTDTLETDRWSHVAFVYDADSSKGYIYINGELVGSGNMQAPENVMRRNNTIGKDSWSSHDAFDGKMDELRIWSEAKHPQALRDSMFMEISPTSPNLEHYYQYTTDAGEVLADHTGGVHGVLENFALTGGTGNWAESYAMVVPQNLQSSEFTDTSFVACWDAPAIGTVEKYVLDLSTDEDFGTLTQSDVEVNGDSTCYTFNGVMTGQILYWRIRAEKSSVSGEGTYASAQAIGCLNPVDSGQIGPNQDYCVGGALPQTIGSIAPADMGIGGDIEYKWQSSTDSTFTSLTDIPNSDSTELVFTDSIFVTTWYRRLARVDCSEDWEDAAISNAVKITLHPLPSINAFNNGPHCEGNIVRLFENGGDCVAWEWYLPGGFVSCVRNPVVSPVENGDHIVIGTSIYGCKSIDTTYVAVGSPTANCADAPELCLDESGEATLLATDIDNGSTGSPDFAITSMTLSGQTDFTCEDAGSAPFPVTLMVTDELGCEDACTTMVTVGDTTSPTPDCASANEVLLLWSGTEVTPASMVSNTEDNCSDPVQLSFSPDFSTPSLMLSCRDRLQDPLELTIYIQDGSGNVTTCVIPQVFVPAAEAENCLCDQEHLHLQNDITSDDYKAKQTIMADGTIQPNDTVMLKAEQSITLSPGFTAAHGSYFAAKIDSCGLEPGSDLSAEEEGTAPRSEDEQAFTTPSDLALRIYPNPFQGQFTLELDLEQPAPVSVELYSLTGGRVSTLLSGEQLPAGTQRLTIDGSRLPAGIYMLSVSAGGERTTRRVVRMQ
jgi:hypothetical protein